MKLSAVVLVGVNLMAAGTLSARAADTASFLEESLADVKAPTSPARSVKSSATAVQAPKSQKISHSGSSFSTGARSGQKRQLTAMTPVLDHSTKLRPFVPGRYLPSESELRAKAEAAAAAKANAFAAAGTPNSVAPALTGEVSAVYSRVPTTFSGNYSGDYLDQLALAAARKVKSVAKIIPAVVPGAKPVLPGQFGGLSSAPSVPSLADLAGAQKKVFSPESAASSVTVPAPVSEQTSAPVVPPPQMAQPNTAGNPFPLVSPPVLSKYEQARLSKLVEQSLPERIYAQGINGDMRGSSRVNPASVGAGPPPFPLSFLGAGQPSAAGASGLSGAPGMEARFGNWHERSNLPESGFHTYIAPKMAGPLTVTRSTMSKSSQRTGKQCISVPAGGGRIAHGCKQGALSAHGLPAKNARKSGAAPKNEFVACYPQYRRYPNGG